MSDVVSNDELNALAAEYVLGTLDYEERKGAAALLEVDHGFRGIVRIWERRFGELHLMVEAVEPDPQLWLRIQPKIAGVEQLALAIPSPKDPVVEAAPVPVVPTGGPPDTELAPAASLPTAEATAAPGAEGEAPPAAAAAAASPDLKLAELAALLPVAAAAQEATAERAAEAPPVSPDELPPEPPSQPRATDQIPRGFVPPPPMIKRSAPPAAAAVSVRRTGRGWMAATLVMALCAVVLAGLIGAWRYFPERLPDQLRVHTVLNLPLPPPPPPPRPVLAPFDE